MSQALERAPSGLAKASAKKTSEGKAAEVERLIAPAIEAMGYDIVRVMLSGGDRLQLQIMAERQTDGGMNVDDCAEVSRAAAAILDVEDPIVSAYTLEVSSPGLDRPLTRLADFDRFAGFEAKVELVQAVEGQRRFRGRLLGVRGEDVLLAGEEGEVALSFADMQRAKLIITDDLIAASRPAATDQDGPAQDGRD
ncbi:MAG: ribosome maturation factor RimP [Kiloniellaceae bacterium]